MRRSFGLATKLSLVALSLVSRTVFGAEEKELTALEVFDRTLTAFDNQRAALRDWQYYQTLTTHQFDNSGKVTARGTWQSVVRPGDPRPLEYIGERMEGKLSFFKSESSASPTATPASSGSPAPTPKIKQREEKEEKNQMESAAEAVRKYNLRERYNWKRLPDENVTGEAAYVIEFEPKPRQNTRSREERFFGLLAGKLWVSRSDFII